MKRKTTVFQVDGYEVTASFSDAPNETAIQEAKQILLSSYDEKKIRTFENNTSEDYHKNQGVQPEP